MCYFDADPCDLFRETDHTARTAKPCFICKWRIPPGAPYRKQAWVFEGDFGAANLCLGCSLIVDNFGRHHGTAPTADWFVQALSDCYQGADKSDPDAKRWRDAMAEILRRGRKRELAA